MNKKGFASSTIVFSLLSVFLIAISILLVTMTNTNKTKSALNEKVVSNIEYGNSSINDIEQRLKELENNTLKIDDIYPVGSIYMSTTDDTIEKVQKRFGGTWEKYSEGRTLIGEGTGTDNNGIVQTFKNSSAGGEYSHYHLSPVVYGINGYFGIENRYDTITQETTGQFNLQPYEGFSTISSLERYQTSSSTTMMPYIVTYMYKRVK